MLIDSNDSDSTEDDLRHQRSSGIDIPVEQISRQ
jgi:hypothetical protein